MAVRMKEGTKKTLSEVYPDVLYLPINVQRKLVHAVETHGATAKKLADGSKKLAFQEDDPGVSSGRIAFIESWRRIGKGESIETQRTRERKTAREMSWEMFEDGNELKQRVAERVGLSIGGGRPGWPGPRHRGAIPREED